jgi:hypothetical protein
MTPDFPAAHRITLPERTTFSGTREPGITRSVYETSRGSSCASVPTVCIPANTILVGYREHPPDAGSADCLGFTSIR